MGERRGAARRRFIGQLIDGHLEAIYAEGVQIRAPTMGTADDIRESAAWMEKEEARLFEEAPVAIRRACAANKRRNRERAGS